ncbi:hypothetical protein EDD18DRAFT_1344806 [Armillaria luteobubalina]|uniref:Uncharacterized protein n=1 Tax=Armillaria luteobubalina TaxID=153913 RepID=A0AA39QJ65_9AGAR|nr:hypothetical protein EDD18DRAFT_1344806 [Armillaria luteobubalina]
MSSHADSASELNASPQSEPIRKVVRTKHGEFLLLGAEVLPPIPVQVPDPAQGFPRDPKIYLAQSWAHNSIPYQGYLPYDTYAAC